jgi:hypothetical protein
MLKEVPRITASKVENAKRFLDNKEKLLLNLAKKVHLANTLTFPFLQKAISVNLNGIVEYYGINCLIFLSKDGYDGFEQVFMSIFR